MNKIILITDWTGRELFQGRYDDKEVDLVLDANRCSTCVSSPVCKECDGTGYSGDFEVSWQDENNAENVYAYINY